MIKTEENKLIERIRNLAAIDRNYIVLNYLPYLKESKDVPTMGVKKNSPFIYYNSEFVKTLDLKSIYFIINHEILHLVYEHPRRGELLDDHNKFNIACDIVVNETLDTLLGLPIPEALKKTICTREQFAKQGIVLKGQTALELYHELPDNLQKCSVQDVDSKGQEGEGESQREGEGDKEKQEKEKQAAQSTLNKIKEEIKEQATKATGKKQGGSITGKQAGTGPSQILSELGIVPETLNRDLFNILEQKFGKLIRREHKKSYVRPRREPCFQNHLPASSYRTTYLPKINIYVDVSGSMNDIPLQIMANLKALKHKLKQYIPSYYVFDTEVHPHDINSNTINHSGGTNINNVLNYSQQNPADVHVLFTDCEDNIDTNKIQKSASPNQSKYIFITNNTVQKQLDGADMIYVDFYDFQVVR